MATSAIIHWPRNGLRLVVGIVRIQHRNTTMRIGIIGFGYLGKAVWHRATSEIGAAAGIEVGFVFNRSPARLSAVSRDDILEDLADVEGRAIDLIIEAAHPDVTRTHGARFLEFADYLPLSVTALADDGVREMLLAVAARSGHQLFLPVGALVGGDSLYVNRDMWREVSITFRKNPNSIDSAADAGAHAVSEGPAILFEGSARDVAAKYPRNVNTMVTCALLSVGLDRCRARLISDPSLEYGIAEVEAWGHDGSYLRTEKRQPMAGVSGTEMVETTWRSIMSALGKRDSLHLV